MEYKLAIVSMLIDNQLMMLLKLGTAYKNLQILTLYLSEIKVPKYWVEQANPN